MGTSGDTSGYFHIQSYLNQGTSFGNIVLNQSGGNVGIGSTAPGAKLDVKQTTTADAININQDGNGVSLGIDSEATTANTIFVNAPTTTTGDVVRLSDCNSLTTGRILFVESNSSDTNSRELVKIINDNSSATGTVPLKIQQDSSNYAMFIQNPTNTTNFGNGLFIAGLDENTTSYPLFIKGNSSTLDEGAGNVKFVVRADGYVGVGTSAPQAPFNVFDAPQGSGTNLYHQATFTDSSNAYNGSPKAGIAFAGQYNSTPSYIEFAGIMGVKENTTHGNFLGQLKFLTNTASNVQTVAMTINSSQQVGIGVTPSAKFHVKGGAWNANMILQGGAAESAITMMGSDGVVDGFVYANGGNIGFLDDDGNWQIQCKTDDYTAFYINNTEYMRLTTTGLGIGTTNSNGKITIQGGGNDATYEHLTLQNTVDNNPSHTNIFFKTGAGTVAKITGEQASSATDGRIEFHTAADGSGLIQRMTIEADGDVAIGTNHYPNTGVRLDVHASDDTKFRLSTGNSSFHATMKASISNDTPMQMTGISGHAWMKQRTSSGEITFHTNGGTEQVRIDSAGNIRLGTPNASDQAAKLYIYENDSSLGNTGIHIENAKSDDAAVIVLEGARTSTNDTAQIVFRNSDDTVGRIACFSGHGSNNDSGELRFDVSEDGTASSITTAMTISTAGDVGIGIGANANFKTYIYDNTSDANAWAMNVYQDGAAGNGVRIDIDSTDTTDFILQCGANGGSTEVLNVMADGQVGIMDTTPSYPLDVTGTIRATSDVLAYSDERVKDNIETIENPLDKIKELRGVSYNRNDIEDKSKKIGVIAQEVEKVLPEVVTQDDNGKYSVAYGNMVGLLIESMKEQQKQIEELKSEIRELKDGSSK